jgi:hypothetical protein
LSLGDTAAGKEVTRALSYQQRLDKNSGVAVSDSFASDLKQKLATYKNQYGVFQQQVAGLTKPKTEGDFQGFQEANQKACGIMEKHRDAFIIYLKPIKAYLENLL